MESHLAFRLPRSAVSAGILIPKYYDPDLADAADLAKGAGFELPELGELLARGDAGSRLGDWIPRSSTGLAMFHTFGLATWRIGDSDPTPKRVFLRQFTND